MLWHLEVPLLCSAAQRVYTNGVRFAAYMRIRLPAMPSIAADPYEGRLFEYILTPFPTTQNISPIPTPCLARGLAIRT